MHGASAKMVSLFWPDFCFQEFYVSHSDCTVDIGAINASLEQRMARWVLECRDRLHDDDLRTTHEFIAQMLGVRRAGISEAAATLQECRLIDYGRGTLSVVDTAGLAKKSCECFAVTREEYERLLGRSSERSSTPVRLPADHHR
jgi:hypothetical protein